MITSKPPKKKETPAPTPFKPSWTPGVPKSGWYTYAEVCKLLLVGKRAAMRYVRNGQIPAPSYAGNQARWSMLAFDELARLGVQPKGTYTIVLSKQSRVAKADYAKRSKSSKSSKRKKGRAA